MFDFDPNDVTFRNSMEGLHDFFLWGPYASMAVLFCLFMATRRDFWWHARIACLVFATFLTALMLWTVWDYSPINVIRYAHGFLDGSADWLLCFWNLLAFGSPFVTYLSPMLVLATAIYVMRTRSAKSTTAVH